MTNPTEKIKAKLTVYNFAMNELKTLFKELQGKEQTPLSHIQESIITNRIKVYEIQINELKSLLDEKTDF